MRVLEIVPNNEKPIWYLVRVMHSKFGFHWAATYFSFEASSFPGKFKWCRWFGCRNVTDEIMNNFLDNAVADFVRRQQ